MAAKPGELDKRKSMSRMYGEDDGKKSKEKDAGKSLQFPPRIGFEDMTQMDDMDLDGVLNNLKDRYAGDLIYTYTSSILVAINPFKRLDIYHKQYVRAYKGKRIGIIPPHIFAIAEAAYVSMVEHKLNQSVLVSGESGAGKTESTKLILQFLSARTDRDSPIETMVLESIPVLEALGNAKTGRNDNSSRFGKFIEIQFDDDHYIIGSRIIPYLLEKSRIICPHEGERNYHVFYEITTGMSDAEKAKYHITKPQDYRFLNTTSCVAIKGLDEAEELAAYKRALRLFQVSEEMEERIFGILASVLHLGNTTYKAKGDASELENAKSEQHLKWVAEMLYVDFKSLLHGLTHKEIKMRSEVIQKPLTADQARDQTDAFAKYIYSTLFDWMVNKLNQCTCSETYTRMIGVLDIFGFEKFDVNSLEQFLINLANEKLQQFFNHHIFKLEQAIYEEEKIDWTQIEFKDNQECLDLVEKRRPPGIIAILDEETKFPKATDETLIEKLHQNFDKKHEYYDKPRLQKRHFGVRHYAGLVEYDIHGWRDKNKDEVPEQLERLMKQSANQFIALIYTDLSAGAAENKMTVGSIFRQQLADLMTLLSSTEPYFIRCVKPNMKKISDNFDDQLIHDQLLFAGMLETIRIRRMGYPVRYLLADFWKRYRCICPEVGLKRGDMTGTLRDLINALGIRMPKDTQIGVTKVFLKQDVANDLEDRRNVALTSVIIKMQMWWRSVSLRSKFVDKRKNALLLQAYWRMAVRRKLFVKQHNKAITLQAYWRMIAAMKQRKALLIKKRKADEERRKKEGSKYKAEEALTAEEKEKLRAIAAGEVLVEAEEVKPKKEKKAKMERTKSIMMKKGQQVEIPINVDGKITIGLGWKGGQWDMDASCLMFRYEEHKDDVYYYKPRSRDGAVTHRSGFQGFLRVRSGDEEGDVEQIDVNLNKVMPKINTIIVVVTVFSQEFNFSRIKEPYVRLIDASTDQEFCRYNIEQSGSETAKIMCKLYRYGFSKWRLKAIGEAAEGRLYKHMINEVAKYLQKEPPKRRFKIKVHRGKLKDVKAMYMGQQETSLNTFCELRFDTDKANTRIVKKSLEPQWKTARDLAGHGDVLEVNVKHHVRFGKEVFLARCLIPLEEGVNIEDQWFKLEQLDKGKGRGQNTVSGDVKLSIIETTPGVTLKPVNSSVPKTGGAFGGEEGELLNDSSAPPKKKKAAGAAKKKKADK